MHVVSTSCFCVALLASVLATCCAQQTSAQAADDEGEPNITHYATDVSCMRCICCMSSTAVYIDVYMDGARAPARAYNNNKIASWVSYMYVPAAASDERTSSNELLAI